MSSAKPPQFSPRKSASFGVFFYSNSAKPLASFMSAITTSDKQRLAGDPAGVA